MAYPSSFYKDPIDGAVERMRRDEKWCRRESQGCLGCKHHRLVLGKPLCLEDETPGKRGYCKRWEE